jgi:hypothetical protein
MVEFNGTEGEVLRIIDGTQLNFFGVLIGGVRSKGSSEAFRFAGNIAASQSAISMNTGDQRIGDATLFGTRMVLIL